MRTDKLAWYRKLLSNERSFDRLFCDVVAFDGFDLYYNETFFEDPVFNHVVLNSQYLESKKSEDELYDLFSKIKAEASSKEVPATIFAENFWERTVDLERAAIDFGYFLSGRMKILSKEVKAKPPESTIEVYETRDIRLWNEVFMRAYSIGEGWRKELLRRERMFPENTRLFLAREPGSESPSGCILVHAEEEIVGIYCVGTVPERRHRGIAAAMLSKVETLSYQEGKRNLTLQTIESDGVTPMYLKLGYLLEFDRDVLKLP